MKKILVTGATGQLGAELVPFLRARYGRARVVAVGHSRPAAPELLDAGPFAVADVRDGAALARLVREHGVDTVYHLAGILSAKGEANPQLAWEVNMGGLYQVLEVARVQGCSLFFPSSIAAFGPGSPLDDTPQVTIQRPQTIYGIAKVSGELLCDYYHHRFGVDTRGLRFPGLISYVAPPGGGTTDYAVEIFSAAVAGQTFVCPLAAGTSLDMMYMPDALRAAVELMEADPARLRHRNAYNVTAMSFTPEELAAAIRVYRPDFTMRHEIDPVRQAIADSWPNRMDDCVARRDWGWRPAYDLATMTDEMLARVGSRVPATTAAS